MLFRPFSPIINRCVAIHRLIQRPRTNSCHTRLVVLADVHHSWPHRDRRERFDTLYNATLYIPRTRVSTASIAWTIVMYMPPTTPFITVLSAESMHLATPHDHPGDRYPMRLHVQVTYEGSSAEEAPYLNVLYIMQ